MTDPLEPVWRWYETARDSMRVASRVIKKGLPGAVGSRHVFSSLSPGEADQRLKEAQQELDNMMVVAMVAVFERALRDHLETLIVPHLPAADTLTVAIRDQVKDDIEYWHLTARIIDEVYKTRVAGDLCGMVKQIINYRHEIAHGHTRGIPPPAFANPSVTYQRLTRFLRDGGVI
jgi:hypothetical protein